MNGLPERTRLDLALPEGGDKAVPVIRDGVDPAESLTARNVRSRQPDTGYRSGELVRIPRPQKAEMLHPLGQLLELGETDRGLNVRQLEVEAEDGVVVVATAGPALGASLILHAADPLGSARIACDDRTALPRRDDLGRGEGEARSVAERAERLAGMTRAERLCGIFDHREPMLARKVDEVDDRTTTTVDVHRHDRFRTGRQRRMRRVRIHPEMLAGHVHQHGSRADCPHRVRSRDEGQVGYKDIIAVPDIARGQRTDEGGRAARDGNPVGYAAQVGDPVPELIADSAVVRVLAQQDFGDALDLLGAEDRVPPGDRQRTPTFIRSRPRNPQTSTTSLSSGNSSSR
jgi:hypothetical protein